jgi:hypothetical protein
MKLKIWYYNFWGHFKLLERSFTKYLIDNGYEFELDQENPDVVFFNSFGGPITYNGNAIKIGYITEDINRFREIWIKVQQNYFDLVIGNLPTLNHDKFCKHPLYIHSANYKEPSKEFMESINDYVKNTDPTNLKFCSLIAGHDMYNNRVPIYNILSKINFIECPGKLINNVSSFDDEGITKRDYLKKFIFNICPENHKGHEGYTSEKIPDAIASGCIPIYYGHTNDLQDCKIFNQKRIIRYDPENEESLTECFEKVKELVEDKDKLIEFYQQPVFNKDAHLEINKMLEEWKYKFDKLINKLNPTIEQYNIIEKNNNESIDTIYYN